MRQDAQHEPKGGRGRPFERHNRVCAHAGEHGARPIAAKSEPGQHLSRPHRGQAEANERKRVAREAERAEELLDDALPIAGKRPHEAPIRPRIPAELTRRRSNIALHHHSRAIVERMGQGRGRLDPRQAVLGQRQATPQRRCDAQRVESRTRVMHESRQGQLGRAQPAANRPGALEHQHRTAGARQGDGGSQAVGAGANDDSIVIVLLRHYASRFLIHRTGVLITVRMSALCHTLPA